MPKQSRRKRRRPVPPPPEIAVVTPSLPERHAMLGEACASLAAQTLRPVAHHIAVDYERQGPGSMLNRLIAPLTTEWLSILPDDDLYDPDHLEALAKHVDEADIVLSWSRITGKDVPQYRGQFVPEHFFERRDTGMRGVFLFRRSLWEKLGGWRENVPLEDWDFLCRAVIAGARFCPVYRETWTYRFHEGNRSHGFAA